MKLLLKPNICLAMEFASQEERDIFTAALRFQNPNPPKESEFNPYYDGFISFFLDPTRQKFPTGFLSHVIDHLGRHGVHPRIEIVQQPSRVGELVVDPAVCDGMVLRPYQLDAVTRAIRQNRGIITAPPRSGKTLIQAAVAKTLDRKSVIFVQRAGLLEQHVENLRKWGLDPGVVQGSIKDFHKQHVVAMLQTVWSNIKDRKMLEWLQSVEVMQIDECHHASADTFYRAALNCPASWRLGYSGTPYDSLDMAAGKFNSDTWRLVGLFGPPIVDVSLQQLQDLGLTVPVHILQVKMEEQPDVSAIDGNNWHAVHEAGVTQNDARNDTIVEIASNLVEQGYLPLVLVKLVSHGELLFERFREADMLPLFAKGGKGILTCQGQGSDWVRGSIGDAYSQLLQGHGNILISTQIGDEGVDLPHVDSLILAVGGKGDQVTTQRIFRPLTATGTKKRAVVIDFDDRQHGVLKRHSATRRRVYRLLGFDPQLVTKNQAISAITSL